ILTMLLPLSMLSASAQSVADFYKGKSINLIIASAEGGGYDISGRLIAAHLSKFLPGRPVIVPRNMAGASGMQAVDYMFNVAAQGNGSGANVLTALNRLVGTKFNMVKGYKSVSESGLAMERGEVQGISSTSWEYVDSKGWIKQGDVGFLYVIGSERNPKISDTPTITELAS